MSSLTFLMYMHRHQDLKHQDFKGEESKTLTVGSFFF